MAEGDSTGDNIFSRFRVNSLIRIFNQVGQEIGTLARRHRKNRLREVKLTPEGWVYLVVLAFITVGSVLRNVNLLILMAGMMYAPLFLNWRLGVRCLRSLDAFRRCPRQIHANELASVQWTCENQMSGMAAWNVVIEDRIEKVAQGSPLPEQNDAAPEEDQESWVLRLLTSRLGKPAADNQGSTVRAGFVMIGSQQSAVQSYRVYFGQRGKYLLGPASLTTSFPFGLILSRKRFRERDTIYVGPEIGNLNPVWEQRIQSVAIGSESIKRQRALEEDEFYALRPWRSGDSKKNIHWRTTAKVGQPIIKQHDQQNNRDFALVLDLFGEPGDSLVDQRCETALMFAATALLRIGNAVHGQVAIGICGEETEICHSRTHKGIVGEAMQQFAIAQPSARPDLEDVLLQIGLLVSRGTPVYVASSREFPEQFNSERLIDVEKNSPDREQARIARRLRLLLPAIRWMNVDSVEFKRIFTQEQASVDEAQMRDFSTRWGANAKR